MLEDMQLRNLAPNTQQAYIRAVAQLAQFYKKSKAAHNALHYDCATPEGKPFFRLTNSFRNGRTHLRSRGPEQKTLRREVTSACRTAAR
jgi:hypothetical protein